MLLAEHEVVYRSSPYLEEDVHAAFVFEVEGIFALCVNRNEDIEAGFVLEVGQAHEAFVVFFQHGGFSFLRELVGSNVQT